MSTQHILFVDDYPRMTTGGGEHHLLRVAEDCLASGYRVGVVCIPGSGLEAQARHAGLEVWPMPGVRGPGVRRALSKLFVMLAPDVVHVHGFYAMTVACPAARKAGVPHVLTTVHSMPGAALDLRRGIAGRLEFALRARMYRRAARSIDRFVCVVEAARKELLGIGIPTSKLMVIANGIPDPRVGRVMPGKSDGAPVVVGSVGRLVPAKGYPDFVDAAAVVLVQDEHVRFRLVGDGEERDSLQKRAADLGIAAAFDFAGWSDDAIAEIAAMDVYVVSSVTETTNLTMLEAMGLGVPVIGTDVGGIAEAVVDSVSGCLVPARQPEALGAAILELTRDPALRVSMGTAGRERFEHSFTLDMMLEEHAALYTALVGRPA